MSTSSALDVYNAALSAIHAKGRLSSLAENSREREECDIWYDLVLRVVQEAAFWPSSKKVVYLPLVSERGNAAWTVADPLPGYKYSYALPSDCLRPWHLIDYSRFALSFDSTEDGVLLHTNTEKAVLSYAFLQTNVLHWTPQQLMATIYGLAGHVAGPITGRGELVQKNFNLANTILIDAQAAAANSDDDRIDNVPEVLLARGYAYPGTSRYFYPHGSLFVGSNVSG